jgi:hypothetical protein
MYKITGGFFLNYIEKRSISRILFRVNQDRTENAHRKIVICTLCPSCDMIEETMQEGQGI